jgi:hypothetical protein
LWHWVRCYPQLEVIDIYHGSLFAHMAYLAVLVGVRVTTMASNYPLLLLRLQFRVFSHLLMNVAPYRLVGLGGGSRVWPILVGLVGVLLLVVLVVFMCMECTTSLV